MSSESTLMSLQMLDPTYRRLWLLNQGLETLTLSGALQLAQEAEEFLSGAELGEQSATPAETLTAETTATGTSDQQDDAATRSHQRRRRGS